MVRASAFERLIGTRACEAGQAYAAPPQFRPSAVSRTYPRRSHRQRGRFGPEPYCTEELERRSHPTRTDASPSSRRETSACSVRTGSRQSRSRIGPGALSAESYLGTERPRPLPPTIGGALSDALVVPVKPDSRADSADRTPHRHDTKSNPCFSVGTPRRRSRQGHIRRLSRSTMAPRDVERAAGTGLTGHSSQRFVPTQLGPLEREATVIQLRLVIASVEAIQAASSLVEEQRAPERPAARP